MEVAASGNLEVSLLDQGEPLPYWLLDCWGLLVVVSWGEVCVEGSPGISNIGFNKRSSFSSIMLGLVTISLGHSITEFGEETGIDDHRGMDFGESP